MTSKMQLKPHILKEIIMDFIMDLYEYLMYWVEKIAPYLISFWVGFLVCEIVRL